LPRSDDLFYTTTTTTKTTTMRLSATTRSTLLAVAVPLLLLLLAATPAHGIPKPDASHAARNRGSFSFTPGSPDDPRVLKTFVNEKPRSSSSPQPAALSLVTSKISEKPVAETPLFTTEDQCDLITANAHALMLSTDRLALDFVRLCAKAMVTAKDQQNTVWAQAKHVLDTAEYALKEALALVDGAMTMNPSRFGVKLRLTRTQIRGRIAAVSALRAIHAKIPGILGGVVKYLLPGWVNAAATMVKTVAESSTVPSWATEETTASTSTGRQGSASTEAQRVISELDSHRLASAKNIAELESGCVGPVPDALGQSMQESSEDHA
jgi:hypothetical protein